MRFDPGESWVLKKPIFDEMKRQFPVTLQLTGFSIILVSAIAIPIGILAAVYQDKWPDYILRTIAIAGLAMPSFFVGLLVVIGLSVLLHWLPPPGFANLWESPWKSFQQLIFPAAALALSSSGVMLRMTRAQMLEVLRDDYVRTARAKGLPERVIILRHALRNALLPVITVLGFQIAVLLGGTVTTEIIFSIPGLGVNLIEAVISKDLPVVQAYVMYFGFYRSLGQPDSGSQLCDIRSSHPIWLRRVSCHRRTNDLFSGSYTLRLFWNTDRKLGRCRLVKVDRSQYR